jgi:hypothetical protein
MKNKPTPENWDINIERYMGGYVAWLIIGNQSFCIQNPGTKKEAQWVKKMLTIALRNLIYGELQRYEIFKSVNHELENDTVESIIEKYLKTKE